MERRFPYATALVLFAAALPGALAAQMPSALPAAGEGIAPPADIAGLGRGPATGLEFSRAWLRKAEEVRRRRAELLVAGRLDGMTPEELAAEGAALTGTLRVPIIPIAYSDVPIPFTEAELHERLFGPARGDTVTFASYWEEVSGGLLKVEGYVTPWVRTTRPARYYLPPERYGWGQFGKMSELRREVLRAVASHVDFSHFDNDGPDGRPNSGDDDGYVDFVAFVYATPCPGDWRAGAIWPHRGTMAPFQTGQTTPDGRPIQVADYVVLPAVNPSTCGPLHVGVLAHEAGHAFGLPDLYDYDGSSQGIGAWGLMGMGSHSAPYSPTHLSAWAKKQLGWVETRWLRESGSLMVKPVADSRVIYRYDVPSRHGRYLLLENRRRQGSDRYLAGEGLLLWHIDPDRGELGAWNRDERRPAVQLIQADGRNDLERGRVADAGDPFPGTSRRRRISVPGTGFGLEAIGDWDGAVLAGVRIGSPGPELVTSVDRLWLAASATGAPVSQSVGVRPEGGASASWQAKARAPWLRLDRAGDEVLVSADPSGLAPGAYTDTVQLVGADGATGRGSLAVRLKVMSHDAPEVVARDMLWSWGLAVSGGEIFQASYGWDPLTMRPRPRVLHLRDGDTHAETLSRLPADALYAPVSGPDGSVYVLARARGENFLYRVLSDGGAELVARGIGSGPAYGATALADGSIVIADWNGVLTQVMPGGEPHVWARLNGRVYQLTSDAAGFVYAATFRGEVQRIDPDGRITQLTTGFEPGRLVALVATPEGEIFAAERGGAGRIIQLRANGLPREITRVPGGEFYGLAVEGRFLYALDLGNRQLLRLPLRQRTSGPAVVAR